MRLRNNTNKDQVQQDCLKAGQEQRMKENSSIVVSSAEIGRIINLGCSMKLIFMQIDGIKIVEDIIKIIRKISPPSFIYKQRLDQVITYVNKKLPSTLTDFDQSFSREARKSDKLREQEAQVENLQASRQQLIQAIVQQLYNARQDALKIEQEDSTISFATNQQNQKEVDREINEYLSQFKMRSEDERAEYQELKKNFSKLEQENKYYKKMVEDRSKACLQKDEKIQSLRVTISKLEELIIKNVSVQNQKDLKLNNFEVNKKSSQLAITELKGRNDTALIKSEGLQRQMVKLKTQIQSLRENLAQSALLVKDTQKQKLVECQKESQFQALSREYAIMKKQVSECLRLQKIRSDSQAESYDKSENSQEQNLNFKVEYEILKEKYNGLSLAYAKLKELYDKLLTKQSVKRKGSHICVSPQFTEQTQDREGNNNKNIKYFSDSKSNKIKSSKKKLDFGSDSEIMRDIDEINRIESMTESIGINSFDEIINSKEMSSKIQGFEYNNSIIYKVNSSKFIQTFEAKLSLVLQYVCLLQLYFARSFLSCIREELMMEDCISIKSISTADLNPSYFIQTQHQETSFNSSKLSNMSSPNRLNTDRIMSQQSNKNLSPIDDLSESAISLPNPTMHSPAKEKTRQKIESLELQMKQISSLITDEYLNPHELREDPEFISRVQKLKQNRIAVVITNLVKENEIFKKCLNQMIKSEENLTKENNLMYFDEDENKKDSAYPQGPESKLKDKQNCTLM